MRKAPLPPGDDIAAADLGRRVATNLREKRKVRSLSLDQLASAAGVSRAPPSQIETMKSNPSLGVLWKIAVGLGVPFAELIGGNLRGAAELRRGDAQVLRSSDGRMESRPLTPAGACAWVEAYELRLAARAAHRPTRLAHARFWSCSVASCACGWAARRMNWLPATPSRSWLTSAMPMRIRPVRRFAATTSSSMPGSRAAF